MKIFGTDYDGVIINIESQKSLAFGKIINKYWNVNEKEAANFWMKYGGTSRRYKFDFFYQKLFKDTLPDNIYSVIENEFSKFLANEYYSRLQLLPGAIELLEFAKQNFDLLFISSGVPIKEIQYLTKLNKLSKYFDLILGTSNKFISKKDHFDLITSKYKYTSLIFIADSPTDMKISKVYPNTTAIGIASNHSTHDLKQSGADYVAKSLKETIKYINKII